MLKKSLFVCLILSSALILTGCPKEIKPKPPTAGPGPAPPTVEDSVVQVPVSVDLASLRDDLNSGIPHTIVEDDGSTCDQYGVYKRSDLTIQINGSQVQTTLPIEYRVKLYAGPKPLCGPPVSCGYNEAARRADVVNTAKLTWNSDWHLDVSSGTDVNAIDSCNLGFLNINVTDKIEQLATGKVQFVNEKVKDEIPKRTNVKSQAQTAWSRALGPIALAQNIWLLLNPQHILVSEPSGSGTILSASVGIIARPGIRVSSQAPPAASSPLPSLQTGQPGNRIHVALDGRVSFTSATDLVSRALVGRKYPLPLNKSITITSARMYGIGTLAILQIGISGDARGTLFLQGTPVYEAVDVNGTQEVITVPNLKYTVETRNILVKIADWLLHEDFEKSLREAAVLPLNEKISTLQNQLNTGINQTFSPHVTLNGSVDNVDVRGVYVDSTQFTVRGVADGSATLTVRP